MGPGEQRDTDNRSWQTYPCSRKKLPLRAQMHSTVKLRLETWFAVVVLLALSVFLLDCSLILRHQDVERHEVVERGPIFLVRDEQPTHRLAVVVPTHSGDLQKAIESLGRWPTKCHSLTLEHADLILYYAGGSSRRVASALPRLAQTGGKCFAETRLVLAKLTKKVSQESREQASPGLPWLGFIG